MRIRYVLLAATLLATVAAASHISLRMNHPFSNVLVGGHSTVPDASVQEECRMIDLPDYLLIAPAK